MFSVYPKPDIHAAFHHISELVMTSHPNNPSSQRSSCTGAMFTLASEPLLAKPVLNHAFRTQTVIGQCCVSSLLMTVVFINCKHYSFHDCYYIVQPSLISKSGGGEVPPTFRVEIFIIIINLINPLLKIVKIGIMLHFSLSHLRHWFKKINKWMELMNWRHQ